MFENIGDWLCKEGEFSDIVLSSRIRLARNIKGFPFAIKMKDKDREELLEIVKKAVEKVDILREREYIDISKIDPVKAQALLERHLVSPDFLSARHPRGVFVSKDQTISLMVNEEDHLRFSVFAPGLGFDVAYKKINEIDDELNKYLNYAFSKRLGYLTACPTNVGTGLRASVLIHLPGLVLTKEIEKVLKGVMQVGLSVRGIYGEGTETRGHFFQIANQVTLGLSETEIIENIKGMVVQLVTLERKARDFFMEKAKVELEDKIYRSYAILRNARVITSEEVINLTSAVRLGIGLGIIKDINLRTLNGILILSQPANLQLYYKRVMSPQERDVKRAEFIRERLNHRYKKGGSHEI